MTAITRLPMGHAISATPMQVHTAMSVIANDGVLMEPMLAKRILILVVKMWSVFNPKPSTGGPTEVAQTVVTCLPTSWVIKAQLAALLSIITTSQGRQAPRRKLSMGVIPVSITLLRLWIFPADKPSLVITIVVASRSLKVLLMGALCSACLSQYCSSLHCLFGHPSARSDAAFVNLQPSIYDRSSRITN